MSRSPMRQSCFGRQAAMTQHGDLPGWIERQARHSVAALERAISATHLTRYRASFGQTVTPARGSVLASPEIADWNPAPDYFFHWVRDSAIVMRTVAEVMADAADPAERARWAGHFADFVTFSLGLTRLDGATFLRHSRHRERTRRGFRRFLRRDDELARVAGDKLLGEPRFNPDGSLDFQRWSRPQFDGPALRALACQRYRAAGGPRSAALDTLLRLDLDFTLRHADRRCIGPWEEAGERAHHYYVAAVQLGALVHGGAGGGAAAARLRAGLDRHWSETPQAYVAIRGGARLDAAVLLGVLDADLPDGRHSVSDPRVQATLGALERLFTDLFPINRDRAAPALGRSADDRYFGGGAWYPTTLAAASLCYRLAAHDAMWLARGDAYMATVRDLTPADGALSEQVDRAIGAPTSARHLTWSYAAFVSAARLRRRAIMRPPDAGC
jgi:glucoamylase